MDECIELVVQLVDQYPLTVIVIDALDECDLTKRTDLLEALETILRQASSLVKIFVSSRDDQDIVCHLQHYPNLDISSDRNGEDIKSFVTTETKALIRKMKLLRHSRSKQDMENLIINKVTDGAGGM